MNWEEKIKYCISAVYRVHDADVETDAAKTIDWLCSLRNPEHMSEEIKWHKEIIGMYKHSDSPNVYRWSEVRRIADEMLDITHGLTANQKDRYAEYLKVLADQAIGEEVK